MDRRSIAFIGLPGSGKTTLSRRVATALSMPWFDSDLEIEAMAGRAIPEIFDQQGEAYFRDLEAECLARLCRMPGIVLAAGGGAVLRNGPLLKESATIVYLRRGIESILRTLPSGTRPLLKDPQRLYALYAERGPIYEGLADITIDNEDSLDKATETVLEALPCICSSSTGRT